MPALPKTLDFSVFDPPSRKAWKAQLGQELEQMKKSPDPVWAAPGAPPVAPFYTHEDLPGDQPAGPALYHPTGEGNRWSIRQNLSVDDPVSTNERARGFLDGGVDALGFVVPDLIPASEAPLRSVDDLLALLDGVDLGRTPVHVEAGLATPLLLAGLIAVAARQGLAPGELTGSLGTDPISLQAAAGHLAAPDALHPWFDAIATNAEAPGFRILTLDLRPFHEAGAGPIDELAVALGLLCEYLAAGTARGLPAGRVAASIGACFAAGSDTHLLEICKFRAFRWLVPQVLEPFGVDPGLHLPVHAETARRNLTAFDPYVNVLRGTSAALSAAIGGCDSIAVLPYDALRAVPEPFAYRLARNTGLILKEEAALDRVADPAAGAYAFEALTDALARSAWEAFQSIEAEGGILAALREGRLQDRLNELRVERARAVAGREQVLVGITRFPPPSDALTLEVPAPAAVSCGSPVVASVTLEDAFDEIRNGRPFANFVDRKPAFEAIAPLVCVRPAVPYEVLRRRTETVGQARGHPVTCGPIVAGASRDVAARLAFVEELLACAGIVCAPPFHPTLPEPTLEGLEPADFYVLCAPDDVYRSNGPALLASVRAADPDLSVWVAGSPVVLSDVFNGSSPDGYLYLAHPIDDLLADLLERLGVR